MFNRLQKIKTGYLLLATVALQAAVYFIAIKFNFIPSWEWPVRIVYLFIYIFCAIVYSIALKKIFFEPRQKLNRAGWIMGILAGIFMFVLLAFSLAFALFLSDHEAILGPRYYKTIQLKNPGQEIYLYRSDFLITTTDIYTRQGSVPVKTKIASIAGPPDNISITESDSIIYMAGASGSYEYNRFSKQTVYINK
ncbi:MAG: hypothetical protein JWO06_381 [Bacteroidota bacterium]|nr:hypothetical protein [Bacteroidota bacterium]